MNISLAFYKNPGDFSSAITITAVGRDESGTLIIQIEIEGNSSGRQALRFSKWHFKQLIGEAEERLQQI